LLEVAVEVVIEEEEVEPAVLELHFQVIHN